MEVQNAINYKMPLYAAEIMIRSGSEIYRAEDTMKRMLAAQGIVDIATFVSPTVILIGNQEIDGYCFMKNIRSRSSNLTKIEMVNEISRNFVQHKMTVDEAMEQLKKVETHVSYPFWMMNVGMSIGCAIFSMLIGGDITDFIATLITSSLSFYICEYINIKNAIFLGNFVSSFLIAFLAIALNKIGLGKNLDSTIVGSVLPLVPGIALTTGVRDFIVGDLMSGTEKIMEAVMISIAIAFGIGCGMTLFTAFGGVL